MSCTSPERCYRIVWSRLSRSFISDFGDEFAHPTFHSTALQSIPSHQYLFRHQYGNLDQLNQSQNRTSLVNMLISLITILITTFAAACGASPLTTAPDSYCKDPDSYSYCLRSMSVVVCEGCRQKLHRDFTPSHCEEVDEVPVALLTQHHQQTIPSASRIFDLTI
ncbi:uncharacterized protein BCR38DRAFT_71571 [Pseudomassariella vexata]|uniref:Uncharacterized protein n=1 Tax=Pseudomassariella vexata TaxID=1141098 RepID=A0A1Y2DI31_9PEZI|nr:uncharacterized protein BCR38DRAFT_71571 [Pseudomassariella vexata]ORY58891.1 hypothetical protein BCR38DRAFT_71571 [Pseudomassariella vexata]